VRDNEIYLEQPGGPLGILPAGVLEELAEGVAVVVLLPHQTVEELLRA
jgi:hypothetical protein